MKRYGISSLLWDQSIENEVIEYLKNYSIEYLEIAPFRIWSTWNPTDIQINNYINKLNSNHLKISSIQAITFSNQEGHVYKLIKNKEYWNDHFEKVLSLTIKLGCETAILGAPSIRKDKDLYLEFIKRYKYLYSKFRENGKYILLEAVPKIYGSNILNNLKSLKCFCQENNYKLHVDLGCFLNEKLENLQDENRVNFLSKAISESFHFHISNRDLKTLNIDNETFSYLKKIQNIGSQYIVFENISQSKNLNSIISYLIEVEKIIKNINVKVENYK